MSIKNEIMYDRNEGTTSQIKRILTSFLTRFLTVLTILTSAVLLTYILGYITFGFNRDVSLLRV
ncbi:uncharacterized protein BX663DRAFT_527005, partial [Cokeromyces recurvatus]|uniref:uncharacterized protein n=1 Tax=Cokeromyces recurvatus TaxID=90255 RepID=UPI00221EE54C